MHCTSPFRVKVTSLELQRTEHSVYRYDGILMTCYVPLLPTFEYRTQKPKSTCHVDMLFKDLALVFLSIDLYRLHGF